MDEISFIYGLASQLRDARLMRSYTQKDAAACIGVSPQALSHWERGVNCPSVYRLVQLCDLYGVSLDVLISWVDPFSGQ